MTDWIVTAGMVCLNAITVPFLSPFDRKADYNGHEKFMLACHSDLLLRWMVQVVMSWVYYLISISH